MRFSVRTMWNTEESDLARAHRERLAARLPVADLTVSNPTRCGLTYPDDLLAPLTDLAAYDYDPDPKGSLLAREAICQYYKENSATINPDNVVLTTSTSEAYGYLFKLICDPWDEVLVPQPSYPLFDYLADIEAVRIATVSLVYDFGWQLDIEGMRRAITDRTRAIVVVHPNNPTGHFIKMEEAERLAKVCQEFGLALIVDEVFLDYGLSQEAPEEQMGSFLGRDLGILVFVVSGISKIVGLPQMKVAWLVASGPGADDAIERLEVVADTYLSMNAPVQRALPIWLEGRAGMQQQIRQRVHANLAELDAQLAGQRLVNRLVVEGGWYAVLRIPAVEPDEVTVLNLLQVGVWVHPGYFFGMAKSGWLVVSLLGRSDEFSTGISRLLRYVQGNQESYLWP